MLLRSLGLEARAAVSPLHPRDPALAALFGFGAQSAAGTTVTADTALTSVTVFRCVRVISETIGQLPLILYKRGTEGKRSRAETHKLSKILRLKPNRFQTPFEWKTMMEAHRTLRGNAYSEVISSPMASVAELMPLHPDRVTPFWANNGTRAYRYQDPKKGERIILSGEMFHLMGHPRPDGLAGMSVVELNRNAIGLDLAQQEQAGRLIKNGMVIPGVLKTDKALTDTALKNLRGSLENHTGARNTGSPLILEQGLDWKQMGLTMADAEFLASRKFSVTDIARMFNVPPHMVGDLDRATFTNIEHQTLGFVKFSMMQLATSWEEAIGRDCLSESEQDRYFAEFLFDALLRGDLASRVAAYVKGIQWGWLSVNDVRRMENMDPIEGGDVYLQPSNMIPVAGADADDLAAKIMEMLNGRQSQPAAA